MTTTIYRGPSEITAKVASDYLEKCMKDSILISFQKCDHFNIRVTEVLTPGPIVDALNPTTYIVIMKGVLV